MGDSTPPASARRTVEDKIRAKAIARGEQAFKKLINLFLGAISTLDEKAVYQNLIDNQSLIRDGFLDLNKPIKDTGSRFLHSAAYHRKPLLIQFLLAHKADPNRANNKGFTPLHFAAEQYKTGDQAAAECIRLLVSAGADVHLKTVAEDNPSDALEKIEQAAGSQGKEYLTALVDERARSKQDAEAVAAEWRGKLTEDFQKGSLAIAPVPIVKQRNTAKEKKAKQSWKQIKQLFRDQDISVASLSAFLNDPTNQNLIEEEYLDLNKQINTKGQRFLHMAAFSKNKDLVSLLLKHGCDPNVKNQKGNTPLHVAVQYASMEEPDTVAIVKLMLDYGGDRNAENTIEGATPADKARDAQIKAIVMGYEAQRPQDDQKSKIETMLLQAQQNDAELEKKRQMEAMSQDMEMQRKLARGGKGAQAVARLVDAARMEDEVKQRAMESAAETQDRLMQEKLKRGSINKERKTEAKQAMGSLIDDALNEEAQKELAKNKAAASAEAAMQEKLRQRMLGKAAANAKGKDSGEAILGNLMDQAKQEQADVEAKMREEEAKAAADFAEKLKRRRQQRTDNTAQQVQEELKEVADDTGADRLFDKLDVLGLGYLSLDQMWELHKQLNHSSCPRNVVRDALDSVLNSSALAVPKVWKNQFMHCLKAIHIADRRYTALRWDFACYDPFYRGAVPVENARTLWQLNHEVDPLQTSNRVNIPDTVEGYMEARPRDKQWDPLTFHEMSQALIFQTVAK